MNYLQLDTFLIALYVIVDDLYKLCCLPLLHQKRVQNPAELERLLGRVRKLLATVIDRLKEHFHLERTRARTLLGLWVRVLAKLTAHTLGGVLNHSFGYEPLALKALVFGHG